jgi:hypothetical protein
MAGGRPREVTPPPDELIALGKEMVKWIKENNPSHISAWYIGEKHILKSDWRKYVEKEEFRTYYENALQLIGSQYIEKDTKIEPNIKQRWLRLYFGDLREQENEDKEFESKLGKTNEDVPPLQDHLDLQHENMRLKALVAKQAAELGHQC